MAKRHKFLVKEPVGDTSVLPARNSDRVVADVSTSHHQSSLIPGKKLLHITCNRPDTSVDGYQANDIRRHILSKASLDNIQQNLNVIDLNVQSLIDNPTDDIAEGDRDLLSKARMNKQQIVNKSNKFACLPYNGYRRCSTVSVAVPSSIIDNSQSAMLSCYLVGRIARSLTIFGVDEVVIYEDKPYIGESVKEPSESATFFLNNLKYLETPQYLRKRLLATDNTLRNAGLLNPLGAPHHTKLNEWLPYREGVVLSRSTTHSKIDCGFPPHSVEVKGRHAVGTRVTVRMKKSSREWVESQGRNGPKKGKLCDGSASNAMNKQDIEKVLKGVIVQKNEPLTKSGLYWGYDVRWAASLWDALNPHLVNDNKCVEVKPYDLKIGTSENGKIVNSSFQLPNFTRMIIVFGGLEGIEQLLTDQLKMKYTSTSYTEHEDVFDMYLNTCEMQTSKTIRTEEAIPISLATLRPYLLSRFAYDSTS